jgi:hypothetical protein
MGRRNIVTLCGSTRFYEAFQRAYYEETMKGNIVLSVGFFMHSADQVHGESVGCTPEKKIELDQLHMDKIDMSDEILVLNVNGYVGESTRNEIHHAWEGGAGIRWLEPDKIPEDIQRMFDEANEEEFRPSVPPSYEVKQTKPLSEVKASDVPRGLSADDVAVDEDRLAAEAHKSVSYEMIDWQGSGPRWVPIKWGKNGRGY